MSKEISYPKSVTIEESERIIEQMKKSICKIVLEDGKEGTGFFFSVINYVLLITNNTLLDEPQLNKDNYKIKIYLGKNNECKEIELKDRIKYTNKEYNITLIEIKKEEKDKIGNINLEIDENINENKLNKLIGETIYIIYHNKEKNISLSYSVIEKHEQNEYNFRYISSINNDNSIALIFNLSNFKIVGMHIKNDININLGIFFNKTIKEFIEKNNKTDVKEISYFNPNYSLSCKRILAELRKFNKDPPAFCSAGPINESDMYNLQASIIGPVASPYKGGIFFLNIHFPTNYPWRPPTIFFKTKIFHPNIREDRNICCCSLNTVGDNWSPQLSISEVMLDICTLLTEPNPNPACRGRNKEATELYEHDRSKFEEIAKEWTIKYANYLSNK